MTTTGNALLACTFVERFDPTDLSGCVLWLDHLDDSTLSEASVWIEDWADKSGQANDATASFHEVEYHPSDDQAGQEFGYALAVDGDTALVGASYSQASGTDGGAVYVHSWVEGTGWTETQILYASDAAHWDRFGDAVALSGSLLVVGAPTADGVASNTGQAYIFTESGGTWTEAAILYATVEGTPLNWRFGTQVAVSEDGTIAVYALGDAQEGRVTLFDSGGVQLQELRAEADGSGGYFGQGLAFADPDTLLIGQLGYGSYGRVEVWTRTAGVWSRAQLLAPSGTPTDFGQCVVMDQANPDRALILGDADAYVFERDGAGVWTEVDHTDSYGGTSGALQGEAVVIGDPAYGGNGIGAAYFLKLHAGAWTLVETWQPAAPAAYDYTGQAVAWHARGVLVGSPEYDGTFSAAGLVAHVHAPRQDVTNGVQHDGVTSYFEADGVAADAFSGTGEKWVILIGVDVDAGPGVIWSFGSSSSDTPYAALEHLGAGQLRLSMRDDAGTLSQWDTAVGVVQGRTILALWRNITFADLRDYNNTALLFQGLGSQTVTVDQFTIGARRRTGVDEHAPVCHGPVVVYDDVQTWPDLLAVMRRMKGGWL
jgi:hypothetical protein